MQMKKINTIILFRNLRGLISFQNAIRIVAATFINSCVRDRRQVAVRSTLQAYSPTAAIYCGGHAKKILYITQGNKIKQLSTD